MTTGTSAGISQFAYRRDRRWVGIAHRTRCLRVRATPSPMDSNGSSFLRPSPRALRRVGPRVRPPRTKRPRHPERSKGSLPLLALRARPEDPTRSDAPGNPTRHKPTRLAAPAPPPKAPLPIQGCQPPHTWPSWQSQITTPPARQDARFPYNMETWRLDALPLILFAPRPEASPSKMPRFPHIPGNLGILNSMYYYVPPYPQRALSMIMITFRGSGRGCATVRAPSFRNASDDDDEKPQPSGVASGVAPPAATCWLNQSSVSF